ncbi:hypothetical protein [Nonomuraea sp. NPDC048916]|uniref:hypothetical protein n=1 Tax=Nonomuraea sp. NPDC048916 TaxID=3154232 RepID=UPI0033F8EBFD
MINRGWVVTGALMLVAAPVVPAAAAGMALVLERVDVPADIGKWVRTGDVLRFRVRLEGAAGDARLAVATSPVRALSSVTCPAGQDPVPPLDVTREIPPGEAVPSPPTPAPAVSVPEASAAPAATRVTVADRRRASVVDRALAAVGAPEQRPAAKAARVCELGEASGERAVDVLLTVPEGADEVVLASVARMPEVSGGATTLSGTASTPVNGGMVAPDDAPIAAPLAVFTMSGRATRLTPRSGGTTHTGGRIEVSGVPGRSDTRSEVSDGTSRFEMSGVPDRSGVSGGTSRAEGRTGVSGVRSGADGRTGVSGVRSGADGRTGVSGVPGRSGVSGVRAEGRTGTSGVPGRVDGRAGTSGVAGRAVEEGRTAAGVPGRVVGDSGPTGSVPSRAGGRIEMSGGSRRGGVEGGRVGKGGTGRGTSAGPAVVVPPQPEVTGVTPPLPVTPLATGGQPLVMPQAQPPFGEAGAQAPGDLESARQPLVATLESSGSSELGAPLPRQIAVSSRRSQSPEPANPLAGPQGAPAAAGGIAALLGGLWVVAWKQRARIRKKER